MGIDSVDTGHIYVANRPMGRFAWKKLSIDGPYDIKTVDPLISGSTDNMHSFQRQITLFFSFDFPEGFSVLSLFPNICEFNKEPVQVPNSN
jgi:hypothetical protein